MKEQTPKEYLRQLKTASIKIEQKKDELERLKAAAESISANTESEIQSLDSPVYIDILYKRYVEYKTLEEIAVEMSYSYRQVLRLHGLALQDFKRWHTMSHLSVL